MRGESVGLWVTHPRLCAIPEGSEPGLGQDFVSRYSFRF